MSGEVVCTQGMGHTFKDKIRFVHLNACIYFHLTEQLSSLSVSHRASVGS